MSSSTPPSTVPFETPRGNWVEAEVVDEIVGTGPLVTSRQLVVEVEDVTFRVDAPPRY